MANLIKNYARNVDNFLVRCDYTDVIYDRRAFIRLAFNLCNFRKSSIQGKTNGQVNYFLFAAVKIQF